MHATAKWHKTILSLWLHLRRRPRRPRRPRCRCRAGEECCACSEGNEKLLNMPALMLHVIGVGVYVCM